MLWNPILNPMTHEAQSGPSACWEREAGGDDVPAPNPSRDKPYGGRSGSASQAGWRVRASRTERGQRKCATNASCPRHTRDRRCHLIRGVIISRAGIPLKCGIRRRARRQSTDVAVTISIPARAFPGATGEVEGLHSVKGRRFRCMLDMRRYSIPWLRMQEVVEIV
ncbi:hypothetical protein B0H14DRAFT_3572091 [Mycena olivaceomarginata]|nr:hypothetical protein B0H14DRAFT_3572091 [Mycena olivaceomarginata]